MMNLTDMLLVHIAEEAGEIIQAVGKSLRFGLYDKYPDVPRTNREDLQLELTDIFAIAELLQDQGVLQPFDRVAIDAKKEKVRRFLKYSEQCGKYTGSQS